MSLQLNRPDETGGLEKRPPTEDGDWRDQLVTPRWGAGLRKRRLKALANPEMNPTSTLMSVLFWVGLAGLTFIILLIGYGSGFWH
jgi:hypothetical protein